jgi:Dihydrouridine synthase (Dus)
MSLNSAERVPDDGAITEMIPRPLRSVNHRYAFFQSIGSPKLVVAPMVDHSELPYRMLTRKYGADLVFTQMFSSNCWVQSMDYKHLNFSTCPDDRPLIIQFAGNDPQTMLKAAKSVEGCCDAIDINLGCPQGIAKRGHYGCKADSYNTVPIRQYLLSVQLNTHLLPSLYNTTSF